MSVAEKIIRSLQLLPESKQSEVFDFVEYLREKIEKQEDTDRANFSISSAMRGMEDEESPYSLNDLKEKFL